ncbi:hypothetical protein UFOVP746_32 [uncultured Caudovirales phage]|uniref:Uncharacterized protein n=1 Tax=uncultured Caudovirales phage TaxID=2100421 RepID=A0A6J7X784_9CAUD|nr:hypothetical protein UFOVP746_32 [uncultured Caudovirales phage]
MIRHDIIRKYLNLHPDTPIDGQQYAVSLFTINQMLAVIEANEREECAKVCESKIQNTGDDWSKFYWDYALEMAALIIRAREKI